MTTGVVMMLALALFGAPVEASAPAVRVTPPTTVPASARCPEWWQLAQEVGWPADEMPTVDRVMHCESLLRADRLQPVWRVRVSCRCWLDGSPPGPTRSTRPPT